MAKDVAFLSDKKHDLPAMPWYIGDWMKAPEVRSLPPDYRGLWFDCICYMWESTERGYLVKPNGHPYSKDEIIRMVGLDNQNSGIWLTYLIDNNVCGVRESDGAIYSRKMVRDEEIRIKRKIAGSHGGNPILVNHMDKKEVNQNTEYENENEIKEEDKDSSKKADILDYFTAKGYPVSEAEEFYNHYESQGWVTGNGIPITNWRVKAENWHREQMRRASDKPKTDYKQKIENSTYKPAFPQKMDMCENGCGKKGTMRLGVRKILVCSKKCYDEWEIGNKRGFSAITDLVNSLSANEKPEERQ